MKILDCVQGSDEWFRARLGMPTASQFDRILTPARRQYAKGATGYRNLLVAEWLLGCPVDWDGNGWTARGTELEAEAREWYQFTTDREVVEVGMVLRADEKVGGSPDGLVGDDGGIEIKCLAAHNHVAQLLDEDDAHTGQVQGLLYLTGRAWWDLVFYNPQIPSVIRRITPDPDYHAALDVALTRFVRELDEAKDRLREHRREPLSMEFAA